MLQLYFSIDVNELVPEEGADNDAPVLVVEEVLLVLLVLGVHAAGVVRLHDALRLGAGQRIRLSKTECCWYRDTVKWFCCCVTIRRNGYLTLK